MEPYKSSYLCIGLPPLIMGKSLKTNGSKEDGHKANAQGHDELQNGVFVRVGEKGTPA